PEQTLGTTRNLDHEASFVLRTGTEISANCRKYLRREKHDEKDNPGSRNALAIVSPRTWRVHKGEGARGKFGVSQTPRDCPGAQSRDSRSEATDRLRPAVVHGGTRGPEKRVH